MVSVERCRTQSDGVDSSLISSPSAGFFALPKVAELLRKPSLHFRMLSLQIPLVELIIIHIFQSCHSGFTSLRVNTGIYFYNSYICTTELLD